jgi:dUTP pyrophosphatase
MVYKSHPDHEARQKYLNDTVDLLNKLKEIDAMPEDTGQSIKVKLINKGAKVPTRSNLSDAGWDLYSTEDITIHEGERRTVKTGISIQMPDEWVGLIWPRSGLAVKSGIDVLAGVIDSGYRGEIMVCLYNTSVPHAGGFNNVEIKKGDRIAQILFQKVPDIKMVVVDELSNSDRGEDGIGSTGV